MAEAAVLSADEEPLEVQSRRSSHQHYTVDKKAKTNQSMLFDAVYILVFGNPNTGQPFPMNEFSEAALLRPSTCLKH